MRDTAALGTRRVTGSITALATVTLDAAALEALDPEALDRLADLVAARLAERRGGGGEPLLSCMEASHLAGVHPETVRRAIRSGILEVAGYVGTRPRLRAESVEAWVADGIRGKRSLPVATRLARGSGRGGSPAKRVLGEALRDLGLAEGRAA
jgi:hypothetical protein